MSLKFALALASLILSGMTAMAAIGPERKWKQYANGGGAILLFLLSWALFYDEFRPWYLSKESSTILYNELCKDKPQMAFYTFDILGDAESNDLAVNIRDVFRNRPCGWQSVGYIGNDVNLRNNKTGIEVVWAENIRLQGKIRIDVDNIYSSLYNAGFCPKRGTHVTLNTKPIKIGIVAGRKTTLLENIKCLAGNTSAWKRLVLWGS